MAPDERSDVELLAAHVAGDAEAFGVLFRRHRDRLWAVALRTMGNPEDAADGLQDGMIAAYRRADSFRGDAAVTTWLHRVVVNACLDRLRAAKVRRADSLPDDLEEYGQRAVRSEIGPAPVADPAEEAVAHDRRAAVIDALARLVPDQRAAIVLVDLEGYSVAEAAEILGCAAGTVKSRCSRGRTRLAELLAHLLGDPADETPLTAGNPTAGRTVPPRSGPRAPPI
ncbi:RNA polymerase sigma factor SigM [Nocardioides fonticola]|uniref:RNA polymerase sigma factor SigM n=1 Tax=Nocardioides fonticola TaxID=450363 RepID=A0ABP7XS31_9ACTN